MAILAKPADTLGVRGKTSKKKRVREEKEKMMIAKQIYRQKQLGRHERKL